MAKKVKYYFDPESLAYRIIKPKRSKKLGYIGLFLLASALFGFLCFVILLNTSYLETPRDLMYKREIESTNLRYAILNKKMDQIDEVLEDLEERDNNIYRAYFNTAPITDEERKAGFKDKNRYKELAGFDNSELVINTSKRVDMISKELAIQSKSL